MEYFILFNILVIRYTNLIRNIILQTIIIVIKIPNLFKQVKCRVKYFFLLLHGNYIFFFKLLVN